MHSRSRKAAIITSTHNEREPTIIRTISLLGALQSAQITNFWSREEVTFIGKRIRYCFYYILIPQAKEYSKYTKKENRLSFQTKKRFFIFFYVLLHSPFDCHLVSRNWTIQNTEVANRWHYILTSSSTQQ